MFYEELKNKKWCYVNLGKDKPYGKRYIVTEDGELYTTITSNKRKLPGLRELYLEVEKKGYRRVKLYDLNGKSHMHRLHRIVLESFTRDNNRYFDDILFPNYFTVDHIDGNPSNNKLTNLRWLSYEDNTSRRKNSYINWSEDFMNSICEMYYIHELSVAKICNILKKSHSTISKFLLGDVHNGYVRKWCKENNKEYYIDRNSENRNWKMTVDQLTAIQEHYIKKLNLTN